MVPLLASILTSTGVAAVISGAFGYVNGSRIEKVKASLAANQERAKKLGKAHDALLSIKLSSPFDFAKAQSDPTAALRELVKAMTADFDAAEGIYVKIRPLVPQARCNEIETAYNNAIQINAGIAQRLRSNEEFDHAEPLKALVGARSDFIKVLKGAVEQAYRDAAGA